MSGLEKNLDVRLLVRWLGVDGAKAGLEKSRACTINLLKDVAVSLGVEVASKAKREDLIEDIIRVASKRIDKPVSELLSMQHDELVNYFEHAQVENGELLDLLKQLDLDPGREGRRNLLEFVARELAETGRFMRIASHRSDRDH
jgi:hypothetical protein